MATTTQIASFSEDGQYLAYSSPDGTLRIYECSTGNLKQEYSFYNRYWKKFFKTLFVSE